MKTTARFPDTFRLLILCTFLYYLWMAAQIPYAHDDLYWGTETGIRYLMDGSQNSRYAGNLIVLTLTRFPLVKTAVMGAVFTAVPLAMVCFVLRCMAYAPESDEARRLRPTLFIAANVPILLMPSLVWTQSYGWVSGFSNYTVSGLLLILYFLLVLRIEDGDRLSGLPVFLFGAVIQLFLENLSVYFFLASLFLVLRRRLKRQKVGKALLLLLAGNLLGLILVFGNGLYVTLWNTGSAVGNYRRLSFDKNAGALSVLLRLLSLSYYDMLPHLLNYSGILPAAILGVLLLRGLRCLLAREGSRAALLCLGLLHVLLLCYYLYCFLYVRYGLKCAPFQRLEDVDGSILHLLYLLLVTFDLLVFFPKEPRYRFWLLCLWASPLLIIAPLTAVNTVFPRSFVTSDLCCTLFFLLLLAPLLAGWSLPLQRAAAAMFAAAFLLFAWHYGRIYAEIGSVNRERLALIREARRGERDTICFPAFPHNGYLMPTDFPPSDSTYRAFYGIPEDVAFTFASEE